MLLHRCVHHRVHVYCAWAFAGLPTLQKSSLILIIIIAIGFAVDLGGFLLIFYLRGHLRIEGHLMFEVQALVILADEVNSVAMLAWSLNLKHEGVFKLVAGYIDASRPKCGCPTPSRAKQNPPGLAHGSTRKKRVMYRTGGFSLTEVLAFPC